MDFKSFPLTSVGDTVQLVGGIWEGDGHAYLCFFPEYAQTPNPVALHNLERMSDEDWKALLRQSDLVETEVLKKAADGSLYKAVIRKCERTVSQDVSWRVFRRDGMRCRYCGNDSVPLTVDHLVLWEDGGPSVEENLVSCCRKCNKTRGRTQYADWLGHPYYKRVSESLTEAERAENIALLATLGKIERMVNVRSR